MGLYPLLLELAGRRVVVVGAGRVAERKTAALLEAGADVVVIAPEATAALARAAAERRLLWHRRPYRPGDLRGAALAFAAAAPREVNAAVA
ncbi:MAG TPA: NAD(P)-dependent oxidoreductase, partial [Thermodesulfobacteriota bacterium]|nr:NAD(P)-dependent oxidoreductase [Thermodesulfobacteriota bacterium]